MSIKPDLTVVAAPAVPAFNLASPLPGRYAGVPEADYFAANAINSSRLKIMGRSAAHCKADMDADEKPDTEAQLLGRMIHCAALEPSRFTEDYCLEPAPADHPGSLTDHASYKAMAKSLNLKVGGSKAELKARILEAEPLVPFWEDVMPDLVDGRAALKPAHWGMAQSILASIADNPKARRSLSSGTAEESLIWMDQATGLACKARLDYYREDLGVVFDVKTTEDARPHAVERDVLKWGYHHSASHYLEGLKALGLPGDNFAWIFIEKKPPYAIGLYFASPDLLLRGQFEMRGYLDRYAECLATDVWPAYSPDFQTVDLPVWAQ